LFVNFIYKKKSADGLNSHCCRCSCNRTKKQKICIKILTFYVCISTFIYKIMNVLWTHSIIANVFILKLDALNTCLRLLPVVDWMKLDWKQFCWNKFVHVVSKWRGRIQSGGGNCNWCRLFAALNNVYCSYICVRHKPAFDWFTHNCHLYMLRNRYLFHPVNYWTLKCLLICSIFNVNILCKNLSMKK